MDHAVGAVVYIFNFLLPSPNGKMWICYVDADWGAIKLNRLLRNLYVIPGVNNMANVGRQIVLLRSLTVRGDDVKQRRCSGNSGHSEWAACIRTSICYAKRKESHSLSLSNIKLTLLFPGQSIWNRISDSTPFNMIEIVCDSDVSAMEQ